jgi:hypothetical protein
VPVPVLLEEAQDAKYTGNTLQVQIPVNALVLGCLFSKATEIWPRREILKAENRIRGTGT